MEWQTDNGNAVVSVNMIKNHLTQKRDFAEQLWLVKAVLLLEARD